uniref:C1q domain-containing protein n=1 Tax=Hucho hucho TaxID=62062 RepID=A0A4W5KGZ8_9TELE
MSLTNLYSETELNNSIVFWNTEPKPTNPDSTEGGPESPKPRKIVAFTAKLNICDSYPTHSSILKFANVLVNEGDGYSTHTGKFNCPLAGLYHFTLHMSTYGRAQCSILKNGQRVVSAYHTSLPDKCCQVVSIGSVIELTEGDQVWVNLWGPTRHDIFATEDNDTVFVGFLLA